MAKSFKSQLGHYYPKTHQEWRKWLEKNHGSVKGIWIIYYKKIYYKKGSGKATISYEDAVKEAFSFGWIYSTVNTLDEERNQQLFTPRKPHSTWSSLNKKRVENL